MRPDNFQIVGEELAIKWPDGCESFITLKELRRHCPCAECKGEVDILGNLYEKSGSPLTARSFEIVKIVNVGNYAFQPFWADGHATGIFSFDYLRKLVS